MAKRSPTRPARGAQTELVIITGLSGSGKGTVLKAFEDLGYYSVDNLPMELVPKFAELVKSAAGIQRAALVIDIREGAALERFPAMFKRIRRLVPTRLILKVFLTRALPKWTTSSRGLSLPSKAARMSSASL